eukprot:9484353-Pyramimonas_sp.AAC.1
MAAPRIFGCERATWLIRRSPTKTSSAAASTAAAAAPGTTYLLRHAEHPKQSQDVGMFSRRINQMQEARVCSHDGPIGHSKCGYILKTDQSDAGSAGMFSRRTNQTQ